MGADGDSGQVIVGGPVGGDDFSLSRFGRGSNDQVMGSSWSPLATHRHKEIGVECCDRVVVVHDGDDVGDVVDERLTS